MYAFCTTISELLKFCHANCEVKWNFQIISLISFIYWNNIIFLFSFRWLIMIEKLSIYPLYLIKYIFALNFSRAMFHVNISEISFVSTISVDMVIGPISLIHIPDCHIIASSYQRRMVIHPNNPNDGDEKNIKNEVF